MEMNIDVSKLLLKYLVVTTENKFWKTAYNEAKSAMKLQTGTIILLSPFAAIGIPVCLELFKTWADKNDLKQQIKEFINNIQTRGVES